MSGYLILFLLIFLTRFIKDKQRRLLVCFIVVTIFSAIRYGIGYDYYGYLETCIIDSSVPWEPIPTLFVTASKATVPFLFFVLSSIFLSFFYYLGISKADSDYMVLFFFYLCFPFLFMDQLGIIRQGMATAALFCAISLRDEHFYKRLLLVLIAYLCHRSAMIGVLVLLPWNKVHKETLWAIFVASFLFGSVLVPISGLIFNLSFISDAVREEGLDYINSVRADEGQLIRLLIYLLTVVCLVFYRKLVSLNKTNAYYIGLVVLGASLAALFSFNSTLSKRTCMFFFSAIVFVVPFILQVLKVKKSFYYFLCIVLFSLTIFIGSQNTRIQDDPGYSVTYPYRTFFDVIGSYL